MNWLTVVFIVVLIGSAYQGWRRRFANEAGYFVSQVVHLAAAALALFLAWLASTRIAAWSANVQVAHWPQWAAHLWSTWQQSPQVTHWLTLIIIYVLISTVLHWLLRPIPLWMMRAIPRMVAASRFGGGILGALIGAVRDVVVGALVFVVLQYTAVPALQSQASGSAPYQTLQSNVYNPWLKPFVTKELPVLTANALQPVADNISLFAIPTGSGTEAGMLVVPQEIRNLARKVTAGKTTDKAKAYAIYEWEIHHIQYDWKKYNDFVYHHKWDQQSPLQTLHTGKGVCADYALLYAEMAHSVGVTVEIDEGIGGTSLEYGPHAWNRVLDRRTGQWLYVDTTWGAESDQWFNPSGFTATHRVQTRIRIEGNAV